MTSGSRRACIVLLAGTWLLAARPAPAEGPPHAFIGLAVTASPAWVAEQKVDGGALVGNILAGSPADRAGLKLEDVIISLDGTPIDGPATLQQMITAMAPNRKIRLDVLRRNDQSVQRLTLAVVLGTAPR